MFRATGPDVGLPQCAMKIGAKRDGTLIAAERVAAATRRAPIPGSPVGAGGDVRVRRYNIPNFLIEGYDVVVNKPKVAAYRAPGAPMVDVRDRVADRRARAAARRSIRSSCA